MTAAELPDHWALECRDLTIRRGGHTVLHSIRLAIQNGDCLCLIGPNGSGKTTLLLALLGLLRPMSGEIRIAGRSLHSLSPRTRGRWIAYVPQAIVAMNDFTVWDIVAAARFPYVSPLRPLTHEDDQRVEGALEQCEIAALAHRPITSISGGERQKALLAAAIAQDTPLLLLDEPTNSLDPAYQIALARLIQQWHRDGRTVVTVSHDLQLAAALGGRTIALRGGTVVADGAAADVLIPERLKEIYDAEFTAVTLPDGRRTICPAWPTAADTPRA